MSTLGVTIGTGAAPRPPSAARPARRWRTCDLGGSAVDLMDERTAVEAILGRTREPGPPLAVVSANLDHVHHFGAGGRWHGVLEQAEGEGAIELLTLLDGMPLVRQAERLTGDAWPRLAGSDLIGPILDEAERTGAAVGFLGGSEATQRELRDALARSRPRLDVRGWWSPPRSVVTDPRASRRLAHEVAAQGVDLLVVGLGKPRQELWIAEHGADTGARALLAFGAVVDFLAGSVRRCPPAVAHAGFEWLYRLAQEPRRLASRYLVDGPPAYVALRSHSCTVPFVATSPPPAALRVPEPRRARPRPRVTAVVVTYNSATQIGDLLRDLRAQTGPLDLRTVVVDNCSTDGTVGRLRDEPGVTTVVAEGNLGYAGGINRAMREVGDETDAVLVLNPDLRLAPDAVWRLWQRLRHDGVGVAVPLMTAADGTPYPSLRHEPTLARQLGDAVLGSRLRTRPAWTTETDWDQESYRHAHPVDWATGACLLVRAETARSVGDWDERYFLYSEEVDFLQRARDAGWAVWFEPASTVRHAGGGSGTSPELAALMTVNRVRYGRARHGRTYAAAVRAIVLAGALARVHDAGARAAVRYLLSRRRWRLLPAATGARTDAPGPPRPQGAVIVPAHDEASVIERTLRPVASAASPGRFEVIVAANACTDDTVPRAAGIDGVTVLDLPQPSKTRALNAADDVATLWPRLYLDADIEISAAAIQAVFGALRDGRVLAARPSASYDTTGASWAVRAYYRARRRIPDASAHLWGAGAYALSEAGHARLPAFPDVTADDLYVDALFSDGEKAVVPTDPVVVRTPRDVGSLLAVLTRTYAGNAQLSGAESSLRSSPVDSRRTAAQLLRSAVTPGRLLDACVYAALVTVARRRARTAAPGWQRDDSSRVRAAR